MIWSCTISSNALQTNDNKSLRYSILKQESETVEFVINYTQLKLTSWTPTQPTLKQGYQFVLPSHFCHKTVRLYGRHKVDSLPSALFVVITEHCLPVKVRRLA